MDIFLWIIGIALVLSWLIGMIIIKVQRKWLKIIKKFLTENWEVLDKNKLLEVTHMIKKLPLAQNYIYIYTELMCFCNSRDGNPYYLKQSLREYFDI